MSSNRPSSPTAPAPPGHPDDIPPGALPAAVPSRGEFEAVLETRQEQGASMEPALVDSFATRIVNEIARQEQMRVHRPPPKPRSSGPALALGISSVVMMVPLTAIALGTGYPWVLIVVAPALALINIAFAWGQRKGDPD